ncbi:MAG: VCBS repeat-containing protein [Planctomycetota bacterium]|nr:VCBS repeat-containing protein [Planctomycetota bacterium]
MCPLFTIVKQYTASFVTLQQGARLAVFFIWSGSRVLLPTQFNRLLMCSMAIPNQLFTVFLAGLLLCAGCGTRQTAGPETIDVTPESIGELSDQSSDAKVVLDRAKQQHIWDAEHTSFELENRFATRFVDAWKARDPAQLETLFAASFTGSTLVRGHPQTRSHSVLSETVWSQDNNASQAVTGPQLASHLVAWFDKFQQIQQPKLRVLSIDRAVDSRESWQARLLLTAYGVGKSGEQLKLQSEHEVTCRFQKDQELEKGAVITHWSIAQILECVSQKTLMEEVTEEIGLTDIDLVDNWSLTNGVPEDYRYQMAVEDYDQDGWMDIALSCFDGKFFLLKLVDGQRFQDVAASLGIRTTADPRTYVAGWIDYDNDGFADLLLGNRLYHNEAGKRFVDVTAASGLRFHRQAMGCQIADYDCDGYLDLYVQYQRGFESLHQGEQQWVGDNQSGAENQLWHNEGNGRFRLVSASRGYTGGRRHTLGACWFFFDQDHYPDLYLANDFGNNVLLRNRGDGTFEDLSETSGTSDFATSMAVAAGDLNNDGQSELYVANMYSKMGRRIIAHVSEEDYPPGIFQQIQGSCAGNRLYSHRADGTYQESSDEAGVNAVGWAYAPAMVDLDSDGWLDLYATTGFISFDRHKPDG